MLKELDISGDRCNIGGTAGVKQVANMLLVNGGLTSLNLSYNQLCGLDRDGCGTYTAEGITAIADALRVNGALTKLSLAKNKLGEEGTKFLCDALVGNNTLKELDLSGDSSFCGTGSNIGGTAGAKHVANLLLVNGGLTSINLSYNQLCGIWTEWRGIWTQHGTYTAEGITAIADALRVNGALTIIDLSGNDLTHYGRDMTGIKELAAALGVNGGLTVANLLRNHLDVESAKMLAEVAKQKGISLCGIRHDQTTADFSGKFLKLPDAILLASDLSQAVVTGALTSVKIRGNKLGDEGWGAIFAAICGNKDSKIMSMDASSE
eukprot:jgi/Chrpa1/27746/Chrysochromulina_OHIO_Genome00027832-RA